MRRSSQAVAYTSPTNGHPQAPYACPEPSRRGDDTTPYGDGATTPYRYTGGNGVGGA